MGMGRGSRLALLLTLLGGLLAPVAAAAQDELFVVNDNSVSVYNWMASTPKAVLQTPAPGTVLAGATVTFTWSAGSEATEYWLDVGTTPAGITLLHRSQGTNLSGTVGGLPTTGQTLYVRLWSLIAGVWQFNDYIYLALGAATCTPPTTAALQTPAPGATLAGATVTFTWSKGCQVEEYWLDVGTTPGGSNLYHQSQGSSLSGTVGGPLTTGQTLYVRLWSLIAGVWQQFNDYTYTACCVGGGSPSQAVLQPPTPVGTWATIPNTALYPAIPFEAKSESAPGGTPEMWSPQGIFAFSGGDVMQLNGVWGFLIWGGGHADSPVNCLFFMPFDGSGSRSLMGPYLITPKGTSYLSFDGGVDYFNTPSRNQSGVVSPQNIYAPKSRHTYSSILAISVNGQPSAFVTGGGLPFGGGTAATRVFDLTQTFAQAMARPDMGSMLKTPMPFSAVTSSSGWDPVQKRVIHRGRLFIGAYYPDTDRWEDWNIQTAPMGSDYQASVAVDVVGRKMYVLGDRLAEVIDLDTKAYTDLRGKPWAAAFPGVGTGYLAGPGVSWHARTKQIVAWVGGNTLLLINPATDTITTVPMGGATVTAATGSGTYGRFRVIPGTDQVVLVNAVDQNAFVGTVPFDGQPTATPTPTPVPVANSVPMGYLDNVSATGVVTAWAADPDRPTQALQVAVVVDGADLAMVAADQPRPDVTVEYPQFTGNHGVVYPLPARFQDGLAHQLRLFAIDDTGSRVELTWSNRSFTLAAAGAPAPTPTPSPTPTPTPSPGTVSVLPGQPLPVGQWIERPNGAEGAAYMAGRGGKHGRAFYHAGLTAMVFAGGDWHTSQPQYDGYGDAVGSEIWSLDSFNDTWTLQRPFCVPGETQPGAPDTVGWAYDSLRNRGLMSPGFYAITQGFTDPCGSIYGWGGYAFDFATKKFSGPDTVAGFPPPPAGWGGDGAASYGLYNPTLDEYLRIRNGSTLERLSLAANTWTAQNVSNGNPNWNPVPNRAQPVIDVQQQAVYWVDTWASKALIKINLATGSVTSIPLPSQYVSPVGADQEVYLAFDPTNRVILVPNSYDMGQSALFGLGIYHVDTGAWEWGAVPASVTGSVWGFDEATGALIGIGKRVQPSSYYLYKYK